MKKSTTKHEMHERNKLTKLINSDFTYKGTK
jgi:hypothetical protein